MLTRQYHDEVARLQKEIEVVTERGKNLKKEIGDLTKEISDLNKHNANTEAAIDSINKILKDSGFQGFSIRAKEGVENVYEVIVLNRMREAQMYGEPEPDGGYKIRVDDLFDDN